MSTTAKTMLLSLESVITFGAFSYVVFRRWKDEEGDDGSFENVVGSLAPKDVVLSILSGVAFALSFFFFQRQILQRMKDVGAESILPLVMASVVGMTVDELVLIYHGPYERFRYGAVSGILLGSVMASNIL